MISNTLIRNVWYKIVFSLCRLKCLRENSFHLCCSVCVYELWSLEITLPMYVIIYSDVHICAMCNSLSVYFGKQEELSHVFLRVQLVGKLNDKVVIWHEWRISRIHFVAQERVCMIWAQCAAFLVKQFTYLAKQLRISATLSFSWIALPFIKITLPFFWSISLFWRITIYRPNYLQINSEHYVPIL